ncbi:hypothetical protein [Algoriphagus litoralis]|uniref:hypothetical protein n=1 Tax=Algoriphagus litoralis TaxID=2202829 RepID=UPI0013004DAC|nr:hypothetical protein [Algoriphagus litoralis]
MIRIFLWLIFLGSCRGKNSDFSAKLFPLKGENTFLTNLDSVKTVGDLTELYCQVLNEKEKGCLTLPYNFKKRKFDPQANTGIQVFGHPMYCTAIAGWRRTLYFSMQDGRWMYESRSWSKSEYLKSDLDSLIKLNILNYAHDPALSDNPHEAIFEIALYPEKELIVLEDFIGKLAAGYQKFLTEQISESLPLDSLQEKYPLLIMISEIHDFPPVPPNSILPTDSLFEIDF